MMVINIESFIVQRVNEIVQSTVELNEYSDFNTFILRNNLHKEKHFLLSNFAE